MHSLTPISFYLTSAHLTRTMLENTDSTSGPEPLQIGDT